MIIRELQNGKSIQLLQGDITKVPVDAIGNAANSELAGGGGVDGAIHAVGGPSLRLELDEILARDGKCPAGSAVATTAGNLPAKYVFHAVGPVYKDGNSGEPDLLASAYRACLNLGEERKVDYLSLPSISTGVYGYPVREASRIAVQTVVDHLNNSTGSLRKVVFVLFDAKTLSEYRDSLDSIAG
jgi:O-acetyl-ADP-ribose deacetylase (regulator of RNase III)